MTNILISKRQPFKFYQNWVRTIARPNSRLQLKITIPKRFDHNTYSPNKIQTKDYEQLTQLDVDTKLYWPTLANTNSQNTNYNPLNPLKKL